MTLFMDDCRPRERVITGLGVLLVVSDLGL